MSQVLATHLAKHFLNDTQFLREWQLFYSLLGLKTDNDEIDFGRGFSRKRKCLQITSNMIGEWASLNGTNGTVKSLLDILGDGNFHFLKDKLSRHFQPDFIINPDLDFDSDEDSRNVENSLDNDLIPSLHTDNNSESGGVRILELLETHKETDEGRVLIFPSYLLQMLKKIGDLPVAIVSINGKKRMGKSFLANLMIKYLKFSKSHPTSWLDVPMEENFLWKQNTESVTSGIQVWHEPIYLTSGDGRKFAVIIVDTQGLFDQKTRSKYSSVIFGFSLFLSSVFIFNEVSLGEDSYENVSSFLEFTKFAMEKDEESEGLFQKFIFLYRDWQNKREYSYGYHDPTTTPLNSPNNLWKWTFHPAKVTSQGQLLRDGILKGFQTTGVFAMSRPRQLPDEEGVESSLDWDVPFRDSVVNFMTHFLSPESLSKSLKRICGKIVSGKELRIFVSSWANLIIQAEGALESTTLMEKTAQIFCLKRIDELLSEYEGEMMSLVEEEEKGLEAAEFFELHSILVCSLEEKFSKGKIYGGKRFLEKYEDVLISKFENSFKQFSQINEVNLKREKERLEAIELEKKRSSCLSKIEEVTYLYKINMRSYLSSNLKGVASLDLENAHCTQVAEARIAFSELECSVGKELLENYKLLLMQRLTREKITFEIENGANIKTEEHRLEVIAAAEQNLNDALRRLDVAKGKLKNVEDSKESYTCIVVEKRELKLCSCLGPLCSSEVQSQKFDRNKYEAAWNVANAEVSEWERQVEITRQELERKQNIH